MSVILFMKGVAVKFVDRSLCEGGLYEGGPCERGVFVKGGGLCQIDFCDRDRDGPSPPQVLTSSSGHSSGQYASDWNAFLLFYSRLTTSPGCPRRAKHRGSPTTMTTSPILISVLNISTRNLVSMK